MHSLQHLPDPIYVRLGVCHPRDCGGGDTTWIRITPAGHVSSGGPLGEKCSEIPPSLHPAPIQPHNPASTGPQKQSIFRQTLSSLQTGSRAVTKRSLDQSWPPCPHLPFSSPLTPRSLFSSQSVSERGREQHLGILEGSGIALIT